jgi:hypothetical protein
MSDLPFYLASGSQGERHPTQAPDPTGPLTSLPRMSINQVQGCCVPPIGIIEIGEASFISSSVSQKN